MEFKLFPFFNEANVHTYTHAQTHTNTLHTLHTGCVDKNAFWRLFCYTNFIGIWQARFVARERRKRGRASRYLFAIIVLFLLLLFYMCWVSVCVCYFICTRSVQQLIQRERETEPENWKENPNSIQTTE